MLSYARSKSWRRRWYIWLVGLEPRVESVIHLLNILLDALAEDKSALRLLKQLSQTGRDRGSKDIRDDPVVRVGDREGAQNVHLGALQRVLVQWSVFGKEEKEGVVKSLVCRLATGDVEHKVENERGQDVAEQAVYQVGDAVGPRGRVLGPGNGLQNELQRGSQEYVPGTELIRFEKEAR